MSEEETNKGQEDISKPYSAPIPTDKGSEEIINKQEDTTKQQESKTDKEQKAPEENKELAVNKPKHNWSLADKINTAGVIVNFIAVVITGIAVVIALWSLNLTKQSVNDANKNSKESNELTKKSVDAATKAIEISEKNYQMSKVANDSNAIASKRASQIAEKALNETQRSYEFSREAAIKEIRAYVVLDIINLKNFSSDSLIWAEISFTNVGKSPAYNVKASATFAFGKTRDNKYIEEIVKNANEVRRDTLPIITLATNQKTSVFVLPHILLKREYEALKNSSYSLYVTLNITYFDIFNIPRFTQNVGRWDFQKSAFLTVSQYNVAN